jgi:translation initiation factor 4G
VFSQARKRANESLSRERVQTRTCSLCSVRMLKAPLMLLPRVSIYAVVSTEILTLPTGAPEPFAQRKRLILQPRTKPAAEEQEGVVPTAESESSEEEIVLEASSEMTEDEAMRKIVEDTKEFFSVRNLDEAEVYFSNLPSAHHFRLVNKLATSAVESKESDAQLVSDFFARAATKKLCTPAALEDGLSPISEAIDDIAIDAPKAFTLFASMVKGAGFDEERQTRLASSKMLLALLS